MPVFCTIQNQGISSLPHVGLIIASTDVVPKITGGNDLTSLYIKLGYRSIKTAVECWNVLHSIPLIWTTIRQHSYRIHFPMQVEACDIRNIISLLPESRESARYIIPVANLYDIIKSSIGPLPSSETNIIDTVWKRAHNPINRAYQPPSIVICKRPHVNHFTILGDKTSIH